MAVSFAMSVIDDLVEEFGRSPCGEHDPNTIYQILRGLAAMARQAEALRGRVAELSGRVRTLQTIIDGHAAEALEMIAETSADGTRCDSCGREIEAPVLGLPLCAACYDEPGAFASRIARNLQLVGE